MLSKIIFIWFVWSAPDDKNFKYLKLKIKTMESEISKMSAKIEELENQTTARKNVILMT